MDTTTTTTLPTVTFALGPLAGTTVRAELCEVQPPLVGRKFLHKDRRPLDPPPACELRLWRVLPDGAAEPFADYEDVPAEGWVCHAEMYAVGDELGPSASGGVLQQSDERANAAVLLPSPATTPPVPKAAPGANMTSALRGATVTHALKLELGGRKALVFAFTDLSSSAEGAFALRYRAFNVLAPCAGVAAACAGAPFTVYSTRTFPGLGQSTELTKALSAIGMHANKRESVRKGGPKRKKASEND